MTEEEIIEELRENKPFRGLSGVSLRNLEVQPQTPFDIKFELESGDTTITVYGEVKNACTPKTAKEIAPWLARMKSLQQDAAFALICPATSPETQEICLENNIDLIDLSGNVSINIPGKFVLQRLGQKGAVSKRPPGFRNPFAGKASRVLRVLLERPKEWGTTEVLEEIIQESDRNPIGVGDFTVSLASISKTLSSLEEELLVRRRDSKYVVAEPKRLLLRWADKYKERYKWNLRSSFKCPNPFGYDLKSVSDGLTDRTECQQGFESKRCGKFAFTGVAAATLRAPFIDMDRIDIFVADKELAQKLRAFEKEPGVGPELRVIYPYDDGVFMYPQMEGEIPLVANVQTYLDLYARGGRDMKQANYLLETTIEPRWK